MDDLQSADRPDGSREKFLNHSARSLAGKPLNHVLAQPALANYAFVCVVPVKHSIYECRWGWQKPNISTEMLAPESQTAVTVIRTTAPQALNQLYFIPNPTLSISIPVLMANKA